MIDIGFFAAFAGGALALLSPCGALLLPAFFAAMTGRSARPLLHAAIFYLGLLLTLVPLGVGVGIVGRLFVQYRDVIVMGTAVVLVAFGIIQLFGFGFDAAKVLPGGQKLSQQAQHAGGYTKTLLLGASSGIAGFCAGPILGAILTLAMAQSTSGSVLTAAAYLAVYGGGMVVPLFGLAFVWNRLSADQIKKLRGRVVTIGGKKFHTTNLITGLLLIIVGVFFYTTNGLVQAPSLLPYGVQMDLQSLLGRFSDPIVDVLITVVIVIAILGLVAYRKQRRR